MDWFYQLAKDDYWMTFNMLGTKFLKWLDDKFPTIVAAIIIFIISWFLIKLLIKMLSKGLKRSKIDVTLHAFIKSLVKITLIVLLAISIATMLGLPSTSLVTALGAVGLALSLAVKDGLANLAGGLILLASKPFVVGDYIEADGTGGTVAKIDLIHTLLRTVDNKQIFIPNGKMSNAVVVNYSAAPLRRLDLEFSISYSEDFEKAKAIIAKIIEQHPLALKEPEPMVRLYKHNPSALIIVSRVWVDGTKYWDLYFDMMELVKQKLDEAKISIPYNQLDVHIK